MDDYKLFYAPVRPGKVDAFHELCDELRGPRRDEAVALRQRAGIERELLYELTTPDGTLAIICWDTPDVAAANRIMATDESEHAAWLRERIEDVHGVTRDMMLNAEPVLVHQVLDLDARAVVAA